MTDDAKELFQKYIDNVTGVVMTWTGRGTFVIHDLTKGDSKNYKIEEIK